MHSFCSNCLIILKLFRGPCLWAVLLSHGVMFLVLNLWISMVESRCHALLCNLFRIGFICRVDLYCRFPIEACSTCVVFTLFLDHVCQEWSKNSIATRINPYIPILRDQILNTVIIISGRSVEKPVFMILKDQNKGNLDKWLSYRYSVWMYVRISVVKASTRLNDCIWCAVSVNT